MFRRHATWVGAVLVGALFAAACGGSLSGGPCSGEECLSELEDQLDDIDWVSRPVEGRDLIFPPDGDASLAETLPPIGEFEMVVRAPAGTTSVEIFTSAEKSGDRHPDDWMIHVAREFNEEGLSLSDGTTAAVEVRHIDSGTGFQFISSEKYLPEGYTPANQLWIEMAATEVEMTEISPQLVPNVPGIVMKDETAEQLRASGRELTPGSVVDAVIAGEIVMGYTNPFASSTGLNFLFTVLYEIADGDPSRITSPDVTSVFEEFQRQVPVVALNTLQIRDSVESEGGLFDAFVMEWQTYVNTESLQSGFEFTPFGIRHDSPLYAVGDVSPAELEVLEMFAEYSKGTTGERLAEEYGFSSSSSLDYEPDVVIPPGEALVEAQKIWKEKKYGGRRVAAVFVVDVSGSMMGTRIAALRTAMLSAQEFIEDENNAVGVVEFSDTARVRLPVEEFDLNQRGSFAYLANQLEPSGGTALYDGILVGLKMLLDDRDENPDTRSILIVLSDGQPTDGKTFGDVDGLIEGLGIPIFTVGFEADVEELRRISSLVEAASIDASETDVEFRMSSLFNATV